jgi:hypothetical protein
VFGKTEIKIGLSRSVASTRQHSRVRQDRDKDRT